MSEVKKLFKNIVEIPKKVQHMKENNIEFTRGHNDA